MGIPSSSSEPSHKFIAILAGDRTSQQKWILRYGAALLAAAVTLLLRRLFDPILGGHAQYVAIFPAVIFAAWYCGVGPSILATATAFLGEKYWFIEPRGSLAIADWGQIVAASIYLLAAAFIIILTELNRHAMQRAKNNLQEAKEAEKGLREARQHLECQVDERTKELKQRNAELVKQADLVRELSGRLLQMRDEERRHMARELHDGLGQIIAAAHMSLSRVMRESGKLSGDASKAVADTLEFVDELNREVRTLSHLLYPPLLDELGLESAVKWYTQGFAERSKIKVSVDIAPNFGRLPRDLEAHIFRIVQECLTNIHRHSGSPTAAIRLSHEGERLRLEVEDTGRGISPEKRMALQSGGRLGVGIRGMRERVRQFGGTLDIHSNQSGTLVRVGFPEARLEMTASTTVTPDSPPKTATSAAGTG
jgi:signal transduction histidine kinase